MAQSFADKGCPHDELHGGPSRESWDEQTASIGNASLVQFVWREATGPQTYRAILSPLRKIPRSKIPKKTLPQCLREYHRRWRRPCRDAVEHRRVYVQRREQCVEC
jgi:hypothetical protein